MFGVVIPVGPGERDLRRLSALVHEMGRHEPRDDLRLIVVDDAPEARQIQVDWPSVTVLRTELREHGRPDILSAHVAGTLAGLEACRGLEFAVKLDTDAAVIGGFSPALRAAFSDPTLGVVGSYDRMSTGATRDWTMWKRRIDAADGRWTLQRVDRRPRVAHRSGPDRRFVAEIRDRAYAFAPPGAHCLGGAYAVSSAFLAAGEFRWRPWVAGGLGEDVVVGLLSSAAGLRMRSLTARGEPFALAWQGLPATPTELVAAGHSIVHSVKCETDDAERVLRHELQCLADAEQSAPVMPERRSPQT